MAHAHFLLCALSDERMGSGSETVVMNQFPVLSIQNWPFGFPTSRAIEGSCYVSF